jgi:hypothetical protein
MGEIPEDIRQALEGYEQFFARKEQFESFCMYLTGLIKWEAEAVEAERLRRFQEHPALERRQGGGDRD